MSDKDFIKRSSPFHRIGGIIRAKVLTDNVVFQNYLTVGQNTLDTTYNLLVNGISSFKNVIYVAYGIKTTTNSPGFYMDIPLSSVDATLHTLSMRIDGNIISSIIAEGDGANGIIGKRIINYGGQCHAKIDGGAADYNPSVVTSDYIITVDTTLAARSVIISTEDRDIGTTANPRVFIIQDIAGNAGANAITISLETAGNIDGAADITINSNYGAVTLMVDGTNGYTI